MHVQVQLDDRLQSLVGRGGQGALLHEDLAKRLGLVEHPGVHRGNQGVAADAVELQGENAEQQVAVGGEPDVDMSGSAVGSW